MRIVEICTNSVVIASIRADAEPQYYAGCLIAFQGAHIQSLLTCLSCGPQSCSEVRFDRQAVMSVRCADGEHSGHVTVLTGARPITFSHPGVVLRSFEKRGA